MDKKIVNTNSFAPVEHTAIIYGKDLKVAIDVN
jgi:hypothetical protein